VRLEKAGDLEMVRCQTGEKPVREGLVNHSVSSSKQGLEAME
jgi:hypothetical protein